MRSHIWYPDYAGSTTEEYEFALSQIQLTDREKEMLRTHYYVHGGSASAQQVAKSMGWTNLGVTNLAVGRLGRKIATALDIVDQLPSISKNRRPELWCAYNTGTSTPEGFMWGLRPAFVEALLKQPWMHESKKESGKK